MSDSDPEVFEKELSRLRPAKTPEALMRRMTEAARVSRQERVSLGIAQRLSCWWPRLRWAAAATVAVAIIVAVFNHNPNRTVVRNQAPPARNSAKPLLKADNVELDQRLVASFDAVAQMPNGEPVCLRCRQWLDAVVLRDSARGVVIERQSPRLEVVPVAFETY